MKEKTIYTCEICHTDYADKEEAKACEKNHKALETATIIGAYRSMSYTPGGYPERIMVKFKGEDKWIEYKL